MSYREKFDKMMSELKDSLGSFKPIDKDELIFSDVTKINYFKPNSKTDLIFNEVEDKSRFPISGIKSLPLSSPHEKTIATISKSVPSSVKREAEETADAFMTKIKQNQDKIKAAKKQAEAANEIKSRWYTLGKTAKKADATAEGLVATNEAVVEMNELIQECVKLTCRSIEFACAMSQTINRRMEEGFVDRDGKLTHLTRNEKEIAQRIIDDSNKWVENQLRLEQTLEGQNNKIDTLHQRIQELEIKEMKKQQQQYKEQENSLTEKELESKQK